jgi:hypothetical protein
VQFHTQQKHQDRATKPDRIIIELARGIEAMMGARLAECRASLIFLQMVLTLERDRDGNILFNTAGNSPSPAHRQLPVATAQAGRRLVQEMESKKGNKNNANSPKARIALEQAKKNRLLIERKDHEKDHFYINLPRHRAGRLGMLLL